MSKAKYKRLQFDFAEKAVERLDELVDETEAASRAEVIRDALRLYEHLCVRVKEGYEIKLHKAPNDEKSLETFFQLSDIRAKKYRMKRVVGGGSETGGAPEIWVKEEIKMPPLKEYIESCKSDWVKEEEECKKIRSTEGWDLLPAARKINALKALFPNGVLPEQYAELFGIVEFIERVSMSLWYKRTEIQKKD